MIKVDKNKIKVSGSLLIRVGWLGVLIALVVECIILSVASPYFLAVSNLFIVARTITVTSIVAIGMTMLIVSGGFDLSVGSVSGLGGIVFGQLAMRMGVNAFVAVLGSLATGVFIGFVNGILVTRLKINPLIVTLGMLSIARGFVYIIEGRENIHIDTPAVVFLGRGYIGPVPFSVILMIIMVVLGSILMRYTVFGRHIYATGGNEIAARLFGVKVDRVRMILFITTSTLAAFTGIIQAGLVSSAISMSGRGLELDVIAAVIIGGASLSGGKGTIIGALIGAAIMGVLKNGFVLLGIGSEVRTIAVGTVIILAVMIDRFRSIRI